MNKYPGQSCQDEEINNAFNDLHHEIVDKIIQFCNKYNLKIDEVTFGIDGMLNSIKYNKWQAATDSYLTLWDKQEAVLRSL